MDDIVIMEDVQPANNIPQNLEGFLFGEPAELLDVLLEVAPIAVLANQVQITVGAMSK